MKAPVRNLALTGGIACGKSTALRLFAEEGAAVIDADDVAHRWMAAGAPGPAAVAAEFGPGVLAADGSVDRRKLSRVVFADPAALARLNAVSHPAIRAELLAWRDARLAEGRLAVAAIPLLYESGMEGDWDAVACIVSPSDDVLRRLAGRGFSPAQARARLAAQWDPALKADRADFVLRNDASVAALRHAIHTLLLSLAP